MKYEQLISFMVSGDLKQRTFLFAVAVGKLCKELPYNAVNREYFH